MKLKESWPPGFLNSHADSACEPGVRAPVEETSSQALRLGSWQSAQGEETRHKVKGSPSTECIKTVTREAETRCHWCSKKKDHSFISAGIPFRGKSEWDVWPWESRLNMQEGETEAWIEGFGGKQLRLGIKWKRTGSYYAREWEGEEVMS